MGYGLCRHCGSAPGLVGTNRAQARRIEKLEKQLAAMRTERNEHRSKERKLAKELEHNDACLRKLLEKIDPLGERPSRHGFQRD